MPIIPTGRRVRAGFTLIELLVVIGIILVLIGILLPVYGKVRMAAYQADTQAEISTIANAITRYYGDFNAYPGPLSNDQIEQQSTSGAIQIKDAATGSISYYLGNNYVSMSQNLTLGLAGGLTVYQTGSSNVTGLYYDCTAVGQGPLCLNPLNPHRYSDYINLPQNSLSNGQFVDAAGNRGNDMGNQSASTASPYNNYNTGIPVFIDHFPTPMPILYMRARVGAPGVIGLNQSPGKLQYDLSQIDAYTKYTNSFNAASGAAANVALGSPTYRAQDGNTYNCHGLEGIEATLSTTNTVVTDFVPSGGPYMPPFPPYPANVGVNAGAYFWNQNATYSGVPLTGGRPRSVDQFILISAGKDGTYGTPDDLTSYGDVMP